jgi:rod shape-determining protein MreC
MSRFKKRVIIVALILIASFTLMFTFKGHRDVTEILQTLSYPYDLLSGSISSASAKFSGILNAADENRRLRFELQAATIEKQSYGEIIAENRRLHDMLNLKAQITSGGTAAHVVGFGYDKFAKTRVIDIGRRSGIVKDMPVITATGLAGKVFSVRKDFSDILLLTDTNFSVAVRLIGSRQEGVLSGSGGWRCILKYVPIEETVKEGEIVITSGLDGIFPPGIPVGRVIKVQTEGVEFFQYIEVAPFQQPSTIEEVLVVGRNADLKGMRLPDADSATAADEIIK